MNRPDKWLFLLAVRCYSQRVEKFEIFVKEGEIWNSIYTGTVIGYKKIISVKGQKAQKVKIVLHDFRVLPLLSFVGMFSLSSRFNGFLIISSCFYLKIL